jgi:hypothetical protein
LLKTTSLSFLAVSSERRGTNNECRIISKIVEEKDEQEEGGG